MTARWCKLHNDFADDVKWLRIAHITGAPVALVQACFARAMIHANKCPDRGSLAGIDLADIAWFYSQPVDLIEAIFNAFETALMVSENRLANWRKRQDEKPPPSPQAARQRRYREAKKANLVRDPELDLAGPGGGHGDEKITPIHAVRDKCNASRRDITQASQNATDSDLEVQGLGEGARGARDPVGFETWYAKFPNRVDKPAARAAYRRALARASPAELPAGIERYITTRRPGQIWRNPNTWLDGDGWLDRPAPLGSIDGGNRNGERRQNRPATRGPERADQRASIAAVATAAAVARGMAD